MKEILIGLDILILLGMGHAFYLQLWNFKNGDSTTTNTFKAILSFGAVFLLFGLVQLFQDVTESYSPLVFFLEKLLLLILTIILVMFNAGKFSK